MENSCLNPNKLRSKWLLLSDRACNLAEQIRDFNLLIKSEGFHYDYDLQFDQFIDLLLKVRSELDHNGFQRL